MYLTLPIKYVQDYDSKLKKLPKLPKKQNLDTNSRSLSTNQNEPVDN